MSASIPPMSSPRILGNNAPNINCVPIYSPAGNGAVKVSLFLHGDQGISPIGTFVSEDTAYCVTNLLVKRHHKYFGHANCSYFASRDEEAAPQ